MYSFFTNTNNKLKTGSRSEKYNRPVTSMHFARDSENPCDPESEPCLYDNIQFLLSVSCYDRCAWLFDQWYHGQGSGEISEDWDLCKFKNDFSCQKNSQKKYRYL